MGNPIQSEEVANSLSLMQTNLRDRLEEYELKVAQARKQLLHVDALLSSLSIKTISSVNGHSRRQRPSLLGSDKNKIVVGKKFDMPLTEDFQDIV